MLGNTRIRQLVTDSQLIDNFNEECLRNCSYRLRVGKLIKPGGAEVLDFNPEDKKNRLCSLWWKIGMSLFHNQEIQGEPQFHVIEKRYELKPNELIVFQTREKISLPLDLSASYTALDSIAKQGILLINASIVEPGYDGYLSGVLLNFSSRSFYIKPNMEIVKINFSRVSGGVDVRIHENVTNYTEDLLEKAKNYTRTFLDIEGIENEVIGKTARRVRRNFVFGGVVLLFFLAFCTIEPVIYNLIWHDSWVPLTSTHIEYERSLQTRREMQIIDSLIKKVDSLQIKLDQQNVRKPDPKPKRRI